MAYPQPGDFGVLGRLAWITHVPGAGGFWVGAVEALASIYGTPPAYGINPNHFTFESPVEIKPGAVQFDVVAGQYANYAVGVQNI